MLTPTDSAAAVASFRPLSLSPVRGHGPRALSHKCMSPMDGWLVVVFVGENNVGRIGAALNGIKSITLFHLVSITGL